MLKQISETPNRQQEAETLSRPTLGLGSCNTSRAIDPEAKLNLT
jgi:hypothetical protein